MGLPINYIKKVADETRGNKPAGDISPWFLPQSLPLPSLSDGLSPLSGIKLILLTLVFVIVFITATANKL